MLGEEQQNSFTKKMEKYILKVKDQNRPDKIVDENLEGVEDGGAGDPDVLRKKKGMIKKQVCSRSSPSASGHGFGVWVLR